MGAGLAAQPYANRVAFNFKRAKHFIFTQTNEKQMGKNKKQILETYISIFINSRLDPYLLWFLFHCKCLIKQVKQRQVRKIFAPDYHNFERVRPINIYVLRVFFALKFFMMGFTS